MPVDDRADESLPAVYSRKNVLHFFCDLKLRRKMMEKQNVTLSLPKPLLKKARSLAARKEISLSELLRESMEEKVREASGYSRARVRQLRLLEAGLDLGTKGCGIDREELHERR